MNIDQLIAQARAFIKMRAPYSLETLYSLTFVETPGVKTLAVTPGHVLYYDPAYFENHPCFSEKKNGEGIGHEYAGGVIFHECHHIIRGMERLMALPNPKLANVAADLAINCNLRDAEWRLPEGVIYPEHFGLKPNLTLEQYYSLLEKNDTCKKLIKGEQCDKQGSNGEQQGPNAPSGGAPEPPQGPAQGQEQGTPQLGPGAGQCGGVAGNPVNAEFEAELDKEFGKTESEKEAVQKATINDIREYVTGGHGTVPGLSASEVNLKERKSTVNWRAVLNKIVRQVSGRTISGGADFSLLRPSRRSGLLGIPRPGLIDQQCEIAFVRDTSGSMGDEQLSAANNEIINIIKKMGIDTVWLLDADTKVQRPPTRVNVRKLKKLEAKGRGGTSFVEPLEAVQKMRPKPDVCIYLTDGDGAAPATAPRRMPVIWCIVPTPYGRKPADWGHMVVCSNDQKLRAPYHR